MASNTRNTTENEAPQKKRKFATFFEYKLRDENVSEIFIKTDFSWKRLKESKSIPISTENKVLRLKQYELTFWQ